MPAAYPGNDAPRSAIVAWMANRAREAGLPAELPVMAGLVESNLTNHPGGDRDSTGFFQMRQGIWNQGAYRGYQQNPELQMQWFIDQAKKADRGSGLGEWVANIERPAEQYRSRYGQRLAEAKQLVAQFGGSGAAAPAASFGASSPKAAAAFGQGAVAAPEVDQRFLQAQSSIDALGDLADLPDLKLPAPAKLRFELDTPEAKSADPAVRAAATRPSDDDLGTAMTEAARQLLGIPYSWGGGTDKGPSFGIAQGSKIKGYDCSALVKAIYARFGISIPRVTYDQFDAGTAVDPAQGRPGDLVFFESSGTKSDPGHVGILIGNGQFIHAPQTGDVVKVSNLADRDDLAGVRRYR